MKLSLASLFKGGWRDRILTKKYWFRVDSFTLATIASLFRQAAAATTIHPEEIACWVENLLAVLYLLSQHWARANLY
ncbi:MAG: hypothetical protein CLLPBCKN_001486 [Chroococcidiopsis cubana SAG 39.79]|uniref:hypothetical protein n=1 Tax=Chroococcidiopsis cubana TaxID=171392 RepID=UPI000D05DC58|nr:hypothetical protein [Chroococcidiopsis cubana]MDZ4872098.1 hypothetical protein [Chroococcidiopsis cubana SAG 39.79]PSB60977.1 hypothetical protein C7B79_23705 [Chroococcidiopsis cubana CCALA 043]